ncbi:unnamed protein product [Hydatigera taeniaeformis]|uniref:Protein kinase domain-containing protein n=1 Tax=Hydatigena taeniaeformis TaxID=6205 RepID=A0A0R3WX34_HYDTA|nr:unnamed protein product [Hydatigera taeniaeformis]
MAIPFNGIERRMTDQLNRCVITNETGHSSGDSNKYANINNKRKVSHEVQAQNVRQNLQPSHQHKDSKTADEKERKDLLKPGEMVKNRWRIVSKIGGGGFGEIYQAVDTQVDSEKVGRNGPDMQDLCTFCSIRSGSQPQRHISVAAMTTSTPSLRLQRCSGCGRECYPSSATSMGKSGLVRKFSEDGLDSADSGISSSHLERTSTLDNYIVAVKAESNTQSKQMLSMEVAVLRKLKGKKNFCELLTCGKTQRINYIVMTLQVDFILNTK